jgi:Transposase DDE domain/Transposase domain (DUF772)
MWFAYTLARSRLRDHSSKSSRKDFTLPQLFACLVVREHQKLTYRGVEALLRDSPDWCTSIGMKRVPDHNTLCRAFHALLGQPRVARLMDHLIRWISSGRTLGSTCAIDSTLYDTHHRSRHYEQRCRHYSTNVKNDANRRRSRSARRTPKLCLSVDTRSHIILAARARTGMGSDAPDFPRLLRETKRRRPGIKTALADAGYDSHLNHEVARDELHIRSLIKTGAGRPSTKPPTSRYRRMMKKQLKGSQKGKPYGQRAQAETVNSMMKRNQGDHLRARTPEGRRKEQMLRVLTHNLSILAAMQDED